MKPGSLARPTREMGGPDMADEDMGGPDMAPHAPRARRAPAKPLRASIPGS
jgi:hypothetical protein